MEINLREKGTMVQALWDSVNETSGNLSIVPNLIHSVLVTGAWRERIHRGKPYHNGSFLEFITTKPMQGCGWPPEKVELLLRNDPTVLAGQHGGDRKSMPVKSSNRTLDHGRGTTLSYTLARLKQKEPELFKRVARGELSANAAAIEAGFRKKLSALDRIRKLIPKLTAEEHVILHRETAP